MDAAINRDIFVTFHMSLKIKHARGDMVAEAACQSRLDPIRK